MRKILIAASMIVCLQCIAGTLLDAPAPWQMQKDQKKGLELIGNDDCATCHGIRRSNGPSIGPSYEEIAIKYRRESFRSTVNLLATRIISGSSGVWGPVPMTRHPSISREDARTMVRYILSVKK